MYHAKALGRNTYSYFSDTMNHDIERRLSIEEQLHNALNRKEFAVHFQPQVEVKTGSIIGAEALVRWNNESLGQVSPAEFIPITEQTGLIVFIGKFVITEAMQMASQWQKNYQSDFKISINISPRQFHDPALVEFIEEAQQLSGLSPNLLELEITEGVLMNADEKIKADLNKLTELGVHIAMDDFGTGYSSLSYLRNYKFNIIKIDKSFIQDIADDLSDRKLVNAIVALSHSLGLKVIAEGVETEAQLSYLEEIGCDYAQGFLFGKPVPADEFTTQVIDQSPACKIV